jgi:predicted nucleotidyltransferase
MTAESRAEALRAELERLVDILAADQHTRQIIVFGSMAGGVVHEWSDLDVAVVMETDLPFLERLHSLQGQIQSQIALDLLVYTPGEWVVLANTRPFIRDEIVAKGHVVYDRAVSALV